MTACICGHGAEYHDPGLPGCAECRRRTWEVAMEEAAAASRSNKSDIRTEWGVDATRLPKIGGIVECGDKAEAQRLSLAYGLEVVCRKVIVVRKVGEWESAR